MSRYAFNPQFVVRLAGMILESSLPLTREVLLEDGHILQRNGSQLISVAPSGGGGGAWGTITGTLSAQTDLQTALDAKQPLDGELTALAGLVSAADKLPYFTGSATASLADLSSFARTILDDANAAAVRTTLGLGTMALETASNYALLASPTFTGTPLAPTAATNTNTTQIATTAYYCGQAGTATPVMDGSAAVGTSLLFSRQDHVHPSDTSRAALAGATFTGTSAVSFTATSAFSVNNTGGSTATLTCNTTNRRVTVGTVGATSLFNVQAVDGSSTGCTFRSYGALSTGTVFTYTVAGGTAASPTQTLLGHAILVENFNGRHDASGNGQGCQVNVLAVDDFVSGGYYPTKYQIKTSNGTALENAMTLVNYDPNMGFGYAMFGPSTADSAGVPGAVTINQAQSQPGFLLTGTGTDGVGDTAGGVVFYMTHNGSGNRQLCFGSIDNYNNSGAAVFRFLFGSGIASIDGVTGNGGSRTNINFGTDTTGCCVGNNSAAYNVSLPGVFAVYGRNGVPSVVVLANASGTDDLQQWTSSAGTVRTRITNAGDVKLGNVGTGLYLKEGTNATMGVATLVAGTITVNTTKVTANSRIFLSVNGPGVAANLGTVYEDAATRVAGTSFTIKSANVLATPTVAWMIVEPS